MCTMVHSWKEQDILDAVSRPDFLSRGTKFASYWVLGAGKTATRSASELLELVDELPHLQPTPRIVHVQSPTRRDFKPHPSKLNDANPSLLWHNGQLVAWDDDIALWDTEYINSMLAKSNPENVAEQESIARALSNLRGAFACFWYIDKELYAFRNAMAPLFVGETSVCSIPLTDKHIPVPPNTVYRISTSTGASLVLSEVMKFNNTYNPYGL